MSNLRETFGRDGYVVLREFFPREEMARVLGEIRKAGGSRENPGDESTERMQFYHNLYRRSDALQAFCGQPRLVAVLRELIGPSFWLRWDHAVEKKPGGEEYPWHQDNALSKVRDASCQVWIALTDADEMKGGLWLQKGSHRHGLLPHRPHAEKRATSDVRAGEECAVQARAGDVVIFSSFILHRGAPNRSDGDRWVYIVEYMSKKHWDPTIRPPYFMIAEKGQPKPELVQSFAGSTRLWNRLKYFRYSKRYQAFRRLFKKNASSG